MTETASGTPAPERAADQIPPWVTKLLWRIAVMVIGILVAWNVVRRISDFLFTIFIAFFLSLALEPAVKWLADRGWRRGPATLLVMGSTALLGIIALAVLVPTTIRQVADLIEQLPTWLNNVNRRLQDWFGWELSVDTIRKELGGVDSSLSRVAGNVAGSVFGVGAAILGGVFRLMTVGLFTFYFVADGPRFRRVLLSAMPAKRQQMVLNAWDVAIDKTGGYLYSRMLMASFSAFFSWISMMILGIPFALPLAIWVGVISQFIPTVGTYIAMFVPLMVALFIDPMDAVWLLILFTAYQQVENYLIMPKVTAKTMALHPAIAFASAIVGGILLGPIGAFLALPVVATVQSGVLVYFVERHEVVEDELTELPTRQKKTSGDDPDPEKRRRWFRREGKREEP